MELIEQISKIHDTLTLTVLMTGSAGGCGDTSLLSAGDTSLDTAMTSLLFFLGLLTGDRDLVGDRAFLLAPEFFCFFDCSVR